MIEQKGDTIIDHSILNRENGSLFINGLFNQTKIEI